MDRSQYDHCFLQYTNKQQQQQTFIHRSRIRKLVTLHPLYSQEPTLLGPALSHFPAQPPPAISAKPEERVFTCWPGGRGHSWGRDACERPGPMSRSQKMGMYLVFAAHYSRFCRIFLPRRPKSPLYSVLAAFNKAGALTGAPALLVWMSKKTEGIE